MHQPLVEFKRATLGYGRKVVLQDVTFSIDRGDYFGLVGPNGSGKTTIVRSILGTLHPLSGSVRIGLAGESTPRIGYVPQRDTIEFGLPYTVQDIVMMGRYRQIGPLRFPGREDRNVVAECLTHVGGEEFSRVHFKNLSGGQKQRTLIARALASRPDILILDEPTNGMDLSSRLAILELIKRLHAEDSLTVVMVSHLLDDLANHVKRLAIVQQGYFQVGDVREMLSGPALSALYQRPVTVVEVQGRTIIVAGKQGGIG